MSECALYEIIKNQPVSATAFDVVIRAPALCAEAAPGRFVHIKCGDNSLLRRPISICDVSGEQMRLVIDQRGEGTRYLGQRKIGQTLDVLGPLGHGFSLPDDARPALLVGGGVGVPPLLFAARQMKVKPHAVLGFRSRDAVMLLEDMRQSCARVVLTTDDGTQGEQGMVDAPLRKMLQSGDYSCLLACGPKPMLRAAAALAEEFGVSCQVSMEERMGCGVGACLVCACKTKKNGQTGYSHVCKDGPVFDAAEVCWDE